MTGRPWTVYVLCDPRSFSPAYVGCTVSRLEVRLGQHCHDACAARRVRLWIETLSREGVTPVIQPLFTVGDRRTGLALETSTIRRLTLDGVRLLNVRHGAAVPSVAHLLLWRGGAETFKQLRAVTSRHTAMSIWRRATIPSLREARKIEETMQVPLEQWLAVSQKLAA